MILELIALAISAPVPLPKKECVKYDYYNGGWDSNQSKAGYEIIENVKISGEFSLSEYRMLAVYSGAYNIGKYGNFIPMHMHKYRDGLVIYVRHGARKKMGDDHIMYGVDRFLIPRDLKFNYVIIKSIYGETKIYRRRNRHPSYGE